MFDAVNHVLGFVALAIALGYVRFIVKAINGR